jgi:hypothetical protein
MRRLARIAMTAATLSPPGRGRNGKTVTIARASFAPLPKIRFDKMYEPKNANSRDVCFARLVPPGAYRQNVQRQKKVV